MLGSVSGSCFCARCNDGGRGEAVVERVAGAAGAGHGVSGFWPFPAGKRSGTDTWAGPERCCSVLRQLLGPPEHEVAGGGTSRCPGEMTGTGKLGSGGPMWEF